MAAGTPCPRCNGTGYTIFHWISEGRCFRCGGVGVITEERRQADAAERADRRLRLACDREATRIWEAGPHASLPAVLAMLRELLYARATGTELRDGPDWDALIATYATALEDAS